MPRREKAQLTYPRDYYIPSTLTLTDVLSEAEIRKEYSRLRKIANQRLDALLRSEFKDAQIVKNNAGKYVPLKEIDSHRDLIHKLSDVARFIESSRGSVRGLQKERRETIQTLHERGYTNINKRNYQQFTQFMDYLHTAYKNHMYDSKRAIQLFTEANSKGKSNKEIMKMFKKWLKHEDKKRKIQNGIQKRIQRGDVDIEL